MSLFNLYAKLSLDSSAYDRGVKEATASGKSLARQRACFCGKNRIGGDCNCRSGACSTRKNRR